MQVCADGLYISISNANTSGSAFCGKKKIQSGGVGGKREQKIDETTIGSSYLRIFPSHLDFLDAL